MGFRSKKLYKFLKNCINFDGFFAHFLLTCMLNRVNKNSRSKGEKFLRIGIAFTMPELKVWMRVWGSKLFKKRRSDFLQYSISRLIVLNCELLKFCGPAQRFFRFAACT